MKIVGLNPVRPSSFRAMSEITALDPVVNVDIDKKRPLVDESQIGEEAKRARVEIERVKKRKVAMLLCYSGQGYLGMQRNPGMQTIEEELINSMLKADLISEEAFTTPQQMQFQRAARTDKGVSAARQVVSLKLPEKAKVEEINEHLPEQIRVLGIKRTTKGFNSKSSCDARTYSYMLPTFSFTPPEQEISEAFRVTPEILEEVRTTLKIFEGTHNFHNFTSRKKPLDPSANRYIMSFCCEEPFLCGDIEFVVLKVKGQSFMLHQIRKMVGVVIAVVRGLTTKETIIRAWNTDRLDIPVAPGLGLVLEEVHYDRYNQKFGQDGIHEVLSWQEFDKDVKDFKEKFIHPSILETEIQEKSYPFMLDGHYHHHHRCFQPVAGYDIREQHLHQNSIQSADTDTTALCNSAAPDSAILCIDQVTESGHSPEL
uniref:Pseudouridylate synthase 1 homolog n=1 Tax=Timema genevievae TaxID=629358 RepID=A0A7R9PIG7_TIMGE|nr:unnamed protein product [Timema genevievae]